MPQVRRAATVDVLPIDVDVRTEEGFPVTPEAVRDGASYRLMAAAVDTLQQRRYAIGGLIDRNGEVSGRGAVMKRVDVERTMAALAAYGSTRIGEAASDLPDPSLPARLGQVSGADATLYLGGWAYVARPRTTTGTQVAEGIAIGIVSVAAIAIVVLALTSSKGHGGGGGSHGGGGGGGGSSFHDHRGGDGGGGGGPSFHDHRDGGGDGPSFYDHRGGGGAPHVRVEVPNDLSEGTGVDAPEHPGWPDDVPVMGEQSQMYVEMTLVDNATGAVLWHAHQRFPASAASEHDLARVARTLLASLPAK
jgi:hypothetical protein